MIVYAGPLGFTLLGALFIAGSVVAGRRRRTRRRRAHLAQLLTLHARAGRGQSFDAFVDSHPFVAQAAGGEH